MSEEIVSLDDSTRTVKTKRRNGSFRGLLRIVQFAALIVAILPLARWTRDYLTAAEVLFSSDDATAVKSLPDGLSYSIQTIDEQARAAIFAHAPSRIEWALHLRPGVHRFEVDLAVSPAAWKKEKFDGVTFRGFIVRGKGERKLFSIRLNPRENEEQRTWLPVEAFVESDGDPVIFALETLSGGNPYHDWAYWGEPRIQESTKPLALFWVILGGVVYFICAWLRWRGREGTSSEKTTVVQGVSLVLLGLLISAALVEGVFQLFPNLFPYSAYRFLPNNGLRYFRESNQRDIYESEIGYLRRSYVHWTWRRKNDLVTLNRISPIYVTSDPPLIHFKTDGDGFRNAKDLESADVIALGDSFTEAPQVQMEEAWPSVLGATTELRVRNLGMSGYAPQQALVALERFGLPLSPKVVLFPIFEGNDLIDAEQHEVYRQSNIPWPAFWAKCNAVAAGRTSIWLRIHHSFLRATFLYVNNLIGSELWGRRPWVGPARYTLFNPVQGEIAGAPLRLAFYDRYLHTCSRPREYWTQRGGWGFTCDTLLEAKKLCEEADARLIVVLFPTKGSVYLPFMQGDYDPEDFDNFIIDLMGETPPEGHTWHGDFLRNYRVLSTIIQEFCTAYEIDHIDLWPAFHQAASRGELIYFPFDTHWNAKGHRLAAETIAENLEERDLFEVRADDSK